ncbi:uncharacterized protein LACBIDRAFT_307767 [Laccaria bicolor S238N-H82]|uniref:Predicted protein n=1 Tax=Laccaria bicolor (strain S238N-H82 / ATCC MYA-4686) TaxID=486041 RepID=B0DQZ8_LACBS|nr:uncharacterized protein LACBIDRAFT_307767 [Laccaria bicolor S238N-H82]EDR02976.1 predicted protein [Laccaria bicolor S238N-H82]|eukprot:XP_001886399.1 predicted protein [Laccaria bicolor S238N-H82]
MPRGINRNRNRSAFSPEVKRPDRTAKNRGLRSFCSLYYESVNLLTSLLALK